MYLMTLFPIGLTSFHRRCAPLDYHMVIAQFPRDVKTLSPVCPHGLSDMAEEPVHIWEIFIIFFGISIDSLSARLYTEGKRIPHLQKGARV